MKTYPSSTKKREKEKKKKKKKHYSEDANLNHELEGVNLRA